VNTALFYGYPDIDAATLRATERWYRRHLLCRIGRHRGHIHWIRATVDYIHCWDCSRTLFERVGHVGW
jgi:hypothetical protein